MLRRLHLVGDLNEVAMETIKTALENVETITKIEYIESLHDLHIDTDHEEDLKTLENIIEENQLNIKFIEKKKNLDKTHPEFEKKVFLFSNLSSQANSVFVISYLMNDPQVRDAKFDYSQKILTVETNDPFIYSKIQHVISAFGEEIDITESYVKEQGVNYALMYRYLYIALVLFSFSLHVVTLQEPTIVTILSGVMMYGLLGYRFIIDGINNIKKKDFINYNNFVLLGSLLLLLVNHALEASIALFIFLWLQKAIESFSHQIIDRLVTQVDNMVLYVKVKAEDGEEEKQVEEVEVGDIVFLNSAAMCYFDGTILDGQAKVDALLMNGQVDPMEVGVGDSLYSGYEIQEGSVELEVTKTYSEGYYNQLYEWSPKQLIEKGYLEIRDHQDNQRFIYRMLIVSMICILAGLLLHNIHYALGGFVTILMTYPLSCETLGAYIYENAMIVALRKRVLMKDENSLSKMMEWAKSKEMDQINEETDVSLLPFKCHQGNYYDKQVREENDCIYKNKKDLMAILRYLKSIDKLWTRTRYMSYIVKVVCILLFILNLLSVTDVLIVTALLSFVILVFIKGIMDKEVE